MIEHTVECLIAQPAPAVPPAAAPAALTDEQIAAVTDAANDGEVQQ